MTKKTFENDLNPAMQFISSATADTPATAQSEATEKELKTRRVQLKLTERTYNEALKLATADSRSFNGYICYLLEREIKANKGD